MPLDHALTVEDADHFIDPLMVDIEYRLDQRAETADARTLLLNHLIGAIVTLRDEPMDEDEDPDA